MKRYFSILLLLLLPLFTFSQNGYLYAEVDSNYVTFWHTGTERICGALYEMDIIVDANQIDWLQNNVGDMAYCICNYDLSVTIGPLADGQYEADIYSIELTGPDTIYYGTIQFEIETAQSPDSTSIVSQYSGPCYNMVNIEEQKQTNFDIQVNATNTTVYINCPDKYQMTDIVVFDQTGKCVFRTNVSGITKTQIDISAFSGGMYIVTARTKSGLSTGKFVKY